MQRKVEDGIIIACDFTGEDWDNEAPMIEGHQGSVLSLKALALAIDHAAAVDEGTQCTMCRKHYKPGDKMWKPNPLPPEANPAAAICWDCIQQADKAFAQDRDIDWDRRIPPDERWR